MAYTYDDFVNAATNSGMMDQFDDDDLTTAQKNPEYGLSLLSLKRDYAKANTDEQKLLINTAADQLKNSYGVKGMKNMLGATTTQPTATDATESTGSFTESQAEATAPTATSTDTAVTASVPAVTETTPAAETATTEPASTVYTRPEFTYDQWTDPSYQAYRKEYLRNADRATADALGQTAAASGGRASSYAVNAATQAGDYYATQLSDKIPTLYQDAYNRFNTEQDNIIKDRQNAYDQMTSLISSTGYMPTAEELASAGMNQEMANKLQTAWIQTNPNKAWAQGLITAKQYYKLKGKWPPGYNPKKSGTGTKTDNPTKAQQQAADGLQHIVDFSSGDGSYENISTNIARSEASGKITSAQADTLYNNLDKKYGR